VEKIPERGKNRLRTVVKSCSQRPRLQKNNSWQKKGKLYKILIRGTLLEQNFGEKGLRHAGN